VKHLDAGAFERLFDVLAQRGYDVVGPTVRDGTIVLDRIDRPDDLPRGVGEEQEAGTYRLIARDDDRVFAWAHGPDSAKRFLFPAREVVATLRRTDGGFEAVHDGAEAEPRPIAFVGLRACDLRAIDVQDRVFFDADPRYRARRERALLIGVNCSEPGATCFCASMGTGPRCVAGFDLALSELEDGFAVEVGSDRGEDVLLALETRDATDTEIEAVAEQERTAIERMRRHVEEWDMPALLYRNRQHPRWKDVAERCLACGNCTLVCPTCFCHDIVDGVSLSGAEATRTREWASCFSEEYSWAAGEVVRHSREARYRQWLTHKFAGWIDQFGTSGCVGCGGCITWCPVGIDVTQEIEAIRSTDGEREVVPS
jgi:sulfhydrogenase subunit beta (sulfur reductase)